MNNTTNTTILTAEQQEVFNKYFITDGDQHIANNNIHFFVSFFNFEVSRDNNVMLEIKVGHTFISMWKRVEHLHITIL
jgi:hypothetical protein